ncbi:MAG TPA: hypothetical protein VFS12_17820, partial [Terriglobia bacterium]|nr:hypothetical protein [Terriglobia bacterium]
KAGNIPETERLYAEIVVEDQSSRIGKLAASNALGQLALAHVKSGNIEEAFRIYERLKERTKQEPPAIVGVVAANLVEAQAKQDDIPGALRTYSSIAGENPYPLMKIVGDRARNGKLSEAQEIVGGLDDASQRYAQWGIVQAQITQGRLTDAQVTASGIKPGHAKASALLELAQYHRQHGANQLALLLLQEADTSARSTVNVLTRADILRRIAAETAVVGDPATAVNIAKSIENDGHRNSAIHDIAKAQAKRGDIAGAFNTAAMLKRAPQAHDLGRTVYETVASDILVEMVKTGKGREARETAAHFQDTDVSRAWLYSGIAMAQADLGHIKEAHAVLALAETEAQRSARRKELRQVEEKIRLGQTTADDSRRRELLKMDLDISRALEAMAKAHARKGDLSAAIALAREANEPAQRLKLIEAVSGVHAQSGYKLITVRWARTLSSPSERVFALVGIATGLSQEADKRKAKSAASHH